MVDNGNGKVAVAEGDYESYIPASSRLVGRTIGNVERQFGLKIDHYHNTGMLRRSNRMHPNSTTILGFGMTVKICGADPKRLEKFCKYFNLPL
jgi:hypothetical protein